MAGTTVEMMLGRPSRRREAATVRRMAAVRVAARARFWAELREGQREAEARAACAMRGGIREQ